MRYCLKCRMANSWPGGFQTAVNGPCEVTGHEGDRNVPCYEYDSLLLEGSPNDINAAVDKEAAEAGETNG